MWGVFFLEYGTVDKRYVTKTIYSRLMYMWPFIWKLSIQQEKIFWDIVEKTKMFRHTKK